MERGDLSAPAAIAALAMTLVVITFASRSTLCPAVIAPAEVAHKNRYSHIYCHGDKVTYRVSPSKLLGFLVLKLEVFPWYGRANQSATNRGRCDRPVA